MSAPQTFAYADRTQRKLLLILEPWARQYWIEPGGLVEIQARGGAPAGRFELEQTSDGLIVYAWEGTTVTILRDGMELEPSPQR
jgi:hypothetical protein